MYGFVFHIGDWIKNTSLDSATERGVHIDHIVVYYTQEGPLMPSQCERIARAYTEAEKEAQKYILGRYFVFKDGAYYNKRCEEEIAKAKAKSRSASESANARWRKEKGQSQNAKQMRGTIRKGCDKYANAMQSQCERITERISDSTSERISDGICERNADGMLSNNQYISDKEKEIYKEKEAEPSSETVQRNVFGEPERDQTRGRKTRIPFKAGDSIPTKFLAYAEKTMPQADHQSEFDRFVDHHLAKGSTSSDWEASWRTWLRNAKKFAQERSEGVGSASAHRTDKDASKRRNGGLGDITTPVGYEVPEGLSTDAGPGGEPGPDCPW